jgi:hypothetical protein
MFDGPAIFVDCYFGMARESTAHGRRFSKADRRSHSPDGFTGFGEVVRRLILETGGTASGSPPISSSACFTCSLIGIPGRRFYLALTHYRLSV